MQLITFLIFAFYSIDASAIKCNTYEKLADYLNTKKFIQANKDYTLKKQDYALKLKDPKIKNKSSLVKPTEPLLQLSDINEARSIAYNFPAIKELGFGSPGGRGWTSYVGRLESSSSYGKKVGWSIKNDKGHARVRLDWDKEKGAHYNIEITQKVNGKSETHKLAVSFLCEKKPCTEKQYLKFAEKMNN